MLLLPSNMPLSGPAGPQGLSQHLAGGAALRSLLVCFVGADILQSGRFTMKEDQALPLT